MKKSLVLALVAATFAFGACSKKTNEEANTAAKEDVVKLDENKAVEKNDSKPQDTQDAKAEDVKPEDMEGDPPFNPEAMEETISSTISPMGKILQLKDLPPDLVETNIHGTVHGTYVIELMHDGMLVFSTERLENKGNDAEAIKKIVTEIEKSRDVQNMKIETTSDVKKIALPAYKLTYRTGHNEDTRECRDYYMHGQDFDYRLHTSIPADFVDEYNGLVDKWIQTMEIVDNQDRG